VAGAVGLAAAIDFLKQLGHDAVAHHEREITSYALARLLEVPGLRLHGTAEAAQRVPVFSFTLDGHTPREVMRSLDAHGIAIRAGDLAALPLLKRFGVTTAARASCYLYTEKEDIDALVLSLEAIQTRSVA
jgi:cysteine desulfurase/selenocysteine lyase